MFIVYTFDIYMMIIIIFIVLLVFLNLRMGKLRTMLDV